MNRWLIGLVVLAIAVILGCGGGGGGTAAGNIDVVGNIVLIETGSSPTPPATVRIGDVSALTDQIDGYFSLTVPAGASQLTVTYTPTGGSPIVRTFSIPSSSSDVDLGDLYIGAEEVTVTGRLLDSTNTAPIAGGTVRIGGRFATSGADGRFSVTQVAFSSSTLSVFLGLQGTVERTSYFTSFFNPPSGPTSGIVDVGTISMVPTGSTTPPPLPTNVSGSITNGGAGATVRVLDGTSIIRTGTADGLGAFKFWVPAGTYTVTATLGAQSGTTNLVVPNVNSLTSVQITLN